MVKTLIGRLMRVWPFGSLENQDPPGDEDMRLLVGLGNPGSKYERNRHNIGFMAVDEIVRRHGFGPWKSKFQGQVSEGRLDGKKVMVLKPETFMNESGRAVGEAARYYKLSPGMVIVLHDELDLAPGKTRMKRGGGHAGHNGLRSIDAHFSKDYWRIRLGIGHPGEKSKVHSYVLNDFAKSETWVTPLIDAVSDAAVHLAEPDDSRFMTRVALLTQGDENASEVKTATPKGE